MGAQVCAPYQVLHVHSSMVPIQAMDLLAYISDVLRDTSLRVDSVSRALQAHSAVPLVQPPRQPARHARREHIPPLQRQFVVPAQQVPFMRLLGARDHLSVNFAPQAPRPHP